MKNNNEINYQKLYQITCNVTPLASDCGKLCNSICCQPDQENSLGMYLFPGEEIMFTGQEDWLQWEKCDPQEEDFPPSWTEPIYFVKCTKPCPREKRPLSCRLFPLTPHLLPDHTLLLIHETLDLPYQCPLMTNNTPLQQEFIQVVARCWQELLKDHTIRDLVQMDSREREKWGRQPTILWWEEK